MATPLRTLGRYKLGSALGKGSFATVYRATDPALGRDVALKVLSQDLASDPEDRKRFLQEGRALAALHHPNIVTVYDVGEADGRPYLAMELIEGETLDSLLQRASVRGLPLRAVNDIITSLASAVDHIHEQGLVHRDIKAANVILRRSGQPMLMDLGIALDPRRTRLTQVGYGLGTPEYAAPEQIKGTEVGPATDVYALGILAYEMLGGKPPFTGHIHHVLYAQAHEAPPPLLAVRPDLPAYVDAAIMQALAKLPVDRPSTAARFAQMLSTPIQPSAGASAQPASPPRKPVPNVLPRQSKADQPADGSSIPPSDDWHFGHLGRDYFDEYLQLCNRVGLGSLRYFYTGKSGEPYAKRAHGRNVSPNFMAEDVTGRRLTFRRGALQTHEWQLKNLIRWPADDVAAYWYQQSSPTPAPSRRQPGARNPTAPPSSPTQPTLTPLMGLPMDKVNEQVHWAVMATLLPGERILFRCMDTWTEHEWVQKGKRRSQRSVQHDGDGLIGTTMRLIVVQHRWNKVNGTGYNYEHVDAKQDIGTANSFWKGPSFQFTAYSQNEIEKIRIKIHRENVAKFSLVGARIREHLAQMTP